MDFEELVMRYAFRNNYFSVAKALMPSLSRKMHLEFAFFIMKHIVSQRKFAHYGTVRELTKQLRQYELPSTSQECDVHRIERAAAYIILMNDLIATAGSPRRRADIISKIGMLLPTTGKFEELDAEIRRSRVTLLAVSMKERRINRLKREFDKRARKMSAQIEKRLDFLRTDLLPSLEKFPLQRWTQSNIPKQAALAELITTNGLHEESLLQYFQILQNTPSLSVDFFQASPSTDLFTEMPKKLECIIID